MTIAINLNFNKRLPTGRPLTLDEGDENWDKLEVAFADLVNQINISIGDLSAELIPNNTGIMFSDGIILGSGRLTGTTNWYICDGGTYNGIPTPDLRNLMIVGSGDEYNTGFTGGIDEAPDHPHSLSGTTGGHALTKNEGPEHNHGDSWGNKVRTQTNSAAGTNDNSISGGGQVGLEDLEPSGSGDPHTHPQGGTAAAGGGHDNKPRCYSLAVIKYCPGV